jgi:hypothetical protein
VAPIHRHARHDDDVVEVCPGETFGQAAAYSGAFPTISAASTRFPRSPANAVRG